jgi:hypothetical protein
MMGGAYIAVFVMCAIAVELTCVELPTVRRFILSVTTVKKL